MQGDWLQNCGLMMLGALQWVSGLVWNVYLGLFEENWLFVAVLLKKVL